MVLFHSSRDALVIDRSQLQASRFLVQLAQVLMHGGVVVDVLGGAAQVLFRQIVLAQLVVGPAQRIKIRAILRIECYRAADVAQRFVQPGATVGQHIAQIVQRHRVLGIVG